MPHPCTGHEQRKNREQFQPTGQHIKNQHAFGQITVCGIIACRADDFKAGADIVEAGQNG